MKSNILKIVLNLSIVIGIWCFVTNVVESGEESQLLAGLGGVLIFMCITIKDFVFSGNYEMTKVWKILSTLISSIGLLFFIYNIIESGRDAKLLSGFGLGITYLGLYIKEVNNCKSSAKSGHFSYII